MMEKTYEPKKFEKDIYTWWEKQGYFTPDLNSDKPSFTIVMPPPNITAQLHIGHALNNAIQDCLIRYKRMKGFNTLWLPGSDHASIATEVKIIEKLKTEGTDKYALGRKKFLERAWLWYAEYGGRIENQLRSLGLSCDWTRKAFTMDENLSKAVKHVFVKLYDKGLIYQGDRIVNWCPCCQTALSDAEVEYEEQASHLWYFKYFTVDGKDSLTFATTRPETMLGDTAVAVNPTDERYSHLIGKKVIVPFVNRIIPVVADEYVEKDFGTGVVKITPAHDPNDFEVGARHDLPIIKVMNGDGTMNELAGEDYVGLTREQCRKKIVENMKNLGQCVKIEDYKHNVGSCYRCHTTVEPIVSKQWFVKMKELAEPAIEVVKDGEINFVPKRFEKTYFNWMENIRDWCISRQLWWGHQIPVWYCGDCGEIICAETAPVKCPKCGGKHLTQDPDVLDTWFSSALWPFSTLGYPDDTADLKKFFPTNVLVTMYDIIFYWVARMIFSSIEHMGKIPFDTVLIHGMVRDSQGRKMSKSLGNGVDPLEFIDNYGADTLRFSLLNGVASGNDMRFNSDKVENTRNFMNKIWNASRFVLMNCEGKKLKNISDCDLTLADKWILTRLNGVIREVTDNIDKYELGIASTALYDFTWSEFCDWYIEFSKPILYGTDEAARESNLSVLVYVLDKILKMLHPFVPFLTEQIYQSLPVHGETIMLAEFPTPLETEYKAEYDLVELVKDMVVKIRNTRAENQVPPSKRIRISIKPSDGCGDITKAGVYIEKLANADVKFTGEHGDEKAISIVCLAGEVFIPMGDMVDVIKETEKINKEIISVEDEIKRAKGKLENQGFVAKAPANLIEAEKAKLADYLDMKQKLLDRLESLKNM
ncbi:MAG TPA: valine--tRNA ligase [Eubacteriales bacterium]|nr:valine--tRNA ligase [Eubacteriales bacterium]